MCRASGSTRVKDQGFLSPFMGMFIALHRSMAFEIPENMSELFKALYELLILFFLLTLLFSLLLFVTTSTAIVFNYHLHLGKSLFVGSEFRIRPNKDNPCWIEVSRKWTDRQKMTTFCYGCFGELWIYSFFSGCWPAGFHCYHACGLLIFKATLELGEGRGMQQVKSPQFLLFFPRLSFFFFLIIFISL